MPTRGPEARRFDKERMRRAAELYLAHEADSDPIEARDVAARFGLSRASVWLAVKRLRAERARLAP